MRLEEGLEVLLDTCTETDPELPKRPYYLQEETKYQLSINFEPQMLVHFSD